MFLWERFSVSDFTVKNVTEGFLLFQENSQWRVKGGRGMLVFDAWAAESSFAGVLTVNVFWTWNTWNQGRRIESCHLWRCSVVTLPFHFLLIRPTSILFFGVLWFKSWDPYKERNSTTLERKVYLHENENQHYRPSKNYTCYKMWCFCLFYSQHSEVKNQNFVTVCGGRSAFVHK